MPCNFNLRQLAEKVKEGIRAAGGTPMEFNTIAISDGVTMGTEGMKTSLVSREVIADSIELVARGHMFDGVVACGCDKTIPGGGWRWPGSTSQAGALRRQHRAGRARQGHHHPGRVRGHGRARRGRFHDEELTDIENHAWPGAGLAAASSPPTRWRWRSRCSGFRRWAARCAREDGTKGEVAEQCGRL